MLNWWWLDFKQKCEPKQTHRLCTFTAYYYSLSSDIKEVTKSISSTVDVQADKKLSTHLLRFVRSNKRRM